MKARSTYRYGRSCKWCNAPLRPKATHRETLEAPSQFNARKFCDRACFLEHRKDAAHKTPPHKLAHLRAITAERRRFSPGDPVWYVRRARHGHGWLHAIPAEIEHYVESYGRSCVRISALLPDGRSKWVTTQEQKLLPRAVGWRELMRLQQEGVPPAALMAADTEPIRAQVEELANPRACGKKQ